MQVGIIVICYNLSSEIFILQMQAIKKFCTDENYTIEIIDNSSDLSMAKDIKYHAGQLGVNYIKTFAGGMGSDSHSFAANFSFQMFQDKYDLMVYLDHDVIPLLPFSASEILGSGHVMAGIGQGKQKKYFWPGCLFFNATAIDKDIIDFSPSSAFGLDTGGNLYKVIEKYGEERCIFFNEEYHQNPYFVSSNYGYYAMINNRMFLHGINLSNWANAENHNERVSTLVNIIKEKTGL